MISGGRLTTATGSALASAEAASDASIRSSEIVRWAVGSACRSSATKPAPWSGRVGKSLRLIWMSCSVTARRIGSTSVRAVAHTTP